MKLLLLQTDIAWQQPEANRKRAELLIEASPKADLIILPEMFTTGFVASPKGEAEPPCGETFEWMRRVAQTKDAALAGSIITEENAKYYNRMYFVKPDGSYSIYDKRHLFTFAGEDKNYSHGSKRVVVEYMGFRILLQICYDLRFPVFSRNRGDYDMIIYSANWPIPRTKVWDTLLRARAIENACYVVGVNRVGSDPYCQYKGRSVLLDYKGREVTAVGLSEECALCNSIKKEDLLDFRKKFPVLNDADDFELSLNTTSQKA